MPDEEFEELKKNVENLFDAGDGVDLTKPFEMSSENTPEWLVRRPPPPTLKGRLQRWMGAVMALSIVHLTRSPSGGRLMRMVPYDHLLSPPTLRHVSRTHSSLSGPQTSGGSVHFATRQLNA